jgi:hypothetical protein
MFSFLKKKTEDKYIAMSRDEKEIARKYGLSFDAFMEMRRELANAKRWGRPAGAKNKKRKKTNVVK